MLYSLTANKSRLVFAVISGNNKVNTSIYAHNITDVRNITFFDIIGYWYVKLSYFADGMSKYFDHTIYKFGTAKLVNKHGKYYLHTTIQRID